MALKVKQGDTRPISIALLEDGAAVDLTNATGARLWLRDSLDRTSFLVSGATLSFVSPRTDGKVEWSPAAGDLDTLGELEAEVEILWPGAAASTYPADGYIRIDVSPEMP